MPPVTALTIVKTQVPAEPSTGAAVTYQIVVTNTGEATISSLTVVDTISPVVVVGTPTQPGAFAAPVVTSVAGHLLTGAAGNVGLFRGQLRLIDEAHAGVGPFQGLNQGSVPILSIQQSAFSTQPSRASADIGRALPG